MKEKNFSIYDEKLKLRINGGQLWRAAAEREGSAMNVYDETQQQLSIYLHPGDVFQTLQDNLFAMVRAEDWGYAWWWQLKKRVPSLLLLIPITMTVLFIGFITVWGDLVINWVFLGENSPTVFGLPMNQSAVIYAVLAIVVIYFFPVLFTGEQEGFIEALNERFSNREEQRKRTRMLLGYLKRKGKLNTVVLWNPDLSEEGSDWVGKSLVPALLDVGLALVMNVRIDERRLSENYIQKRIGTPIAWEEGSLKQDLETELQPIPYEYLETWEKSLLAVYVFASTASLSKRWQLEGDPKDGVLPNAVSLPMVKLLVERFKERLFLEEDLPKLISLELFASRCLNDYGILSEVLSYTNDVWLIDASIVSQERAVVEEEMKFMSSYLQTEIELLEQELDDPVAGLKLNALQEQESVYHEHRLAAIRQFVRLTLNYEQYNIFKRYWGLLVEEIATKEDRSQAVYRIIGIEALLNLATIFERAAMYQHAWQALEYIERVFPFRGIVGKGRVQERQGNFKASVDMMLEVLEDWKAQRIQLAQDSLVDLNLNIAWAIVSGRLEQQRVIGRASIEAAEALLYATFDNVRNSDQTIRLYNILANYAEWEGKPEAAIDNYDKALQIPGVHQSGLSNLLVNKGIALRQLGRLAPAAEFGAEGVAIKSAIGDADQLPIAQHNLAQTNLLLAQASQDQQQLQALKDAFKHATDGLAIQAETGSIKKRGQLLTEAFLAAWWLKKEDHVLDFDLQKSWQAVQSWLREQVTAGRATTYDCKVVVEELLWSEPELKDLSLDELLSYTFSSVQ